MQFDHDKLIGHIRSVNPRTEHHGEEEKLACDVGIRLMKAENADYWDRILIELHHDNEEAAGLVEAMSTVVSKLPFVASCGDSKVNIWQGNRKPASLPFAKINKFVWQTEDGAQFIDLRVQALADGETIGAIAELIDQKIRLETVVKQEELDLNESDESEATA